MRRKALAEWASLYSIRRTQRLQQKVKAIVAKKNTDGNGQEGGIALLEKEEAAEDVGLDLSASKPVGLRLLLEGITPLIMDHFPTQEAYDVLCLGKRPPKDTESTPEERCKKKIYRNSDGKIIIPASNFWACLVGAGKRVKFKGNTNVSNSTSTLLSLFLAPVDIEHLLITPEGVGVDGEGWDPNIGIGRLPGNGVANALVRPMFKKWSFEANFEYDPGLAPQMTKPVVLTLFKIAGRGLGLGSFNPAHKGMNGTFKVVKWEEYEISNDV